MTDYSNMDRSDDHRSDDKRPSSQWATDRLAERTFFVGLNMADAADALGLVPLGVRVRTRRHHDGQQDTRCDLLAFGIRIYICIYDEATSYVRTCIHL